MADEPDTGAVQEVPEAGADLPHDLLARARADARARGASTGAPGAASASGGSARGRKRAVPDQRSGAGPDDRDPQRVDALVDDLVASRDWRTSLAGGAVEAAWAQVVGPEVSARCHPEAFAGGVLTVRAESTAWATQVRLLVPVLLARLAEQVGDGQVTRIDVKGPDAPSWRKGRLRVPGRGPRDTYG